MKEGQKTILIAFDGKEFPSGGNGALECLRYERDRYKERVIVIVPYANCQANLKAVANYMSDQEQISDDALAAIADLIEKEQEVRSYERRMDELKEIKERTRK